MRINHFSASKPMIPSIYKNNLYTRNWSLVESGTGNEHKLSRKSERDKLLLNLIFHTDQWIYLSLKLYVHLNVWSKLKTLPILKSQGRMLLDVIFEERIQFRHVHLYKFKRLVRSSTTSIAILLNDSLIRILKHINGCHNQDYKFSSIWKCKNTSLDYKIYE